MPASLGRWVRAAGAAVLLAGAALAWAPPSQAATSRFCDSRLQTTALDQDRRLRFAAVVRQVLDDTPQRVALISRAGLDLGRFGIRYSHAGIALKPDGGSWAVRQLYYACDESRSRLFDEGVTGFLMGMDDPDHGYIAIVRLPEAESLALREAALDKARALALLSADYSANAYPFSTRYQNCNQWVMEMLATAWAAPGVPMRTRQDAQAWLQAEGYAPTAVDVGSHALLWGAQFVPLLHVRDHPVARLQALRVDVSLPGAIEAFVRQRAPGSERIEVCHDERRIVVRRGWQPIGPGCEPAAGDEVTPLDP